MIFRSNQNRNKFKRMKKLICSDRIKVKVVTFPLLAGLVVLSFSLAPVAQADQFDQQIQTLQTQNSADQNNLDSLESQATSYQGEINLLQSQISSIEAQIASNQQEQASLQQQIATAQAKLSQEKLELGADVKAIYVNGQMSTLEELATSQNLSDFVDAETYRDAIQSQIQLTLTQITNLEDELNTQQQQVTQLLQSNQTQQTQLSADDQQQTQLLSLNQTQQTQFDQQISANNSQIEQLRAEQIAANNKGVLQTLAEGQCGGGYPNSLCMAAQDSIVDPWHMLNRECVSYAAWRVSQESPVGNALLQEYNFGNATDWPSSAETYGAQDGVTVSSTPQAGDIAIREAIPGLYFAPGDPDVGHAMYVESVIDSNTILVSQYNENLNGEYSEQTRSSADLEYIHFPSWLVIRYNSYING